MNKYFFLGIIGLTIVVLTATTLFAQTVAGSSIIARMKAGAGDFTLTSELNAGETGLRSAPILGKETGDILTAGEWNRMLELVAQGGGISNVELVTSQNVGTAAGTSYANRWSEANCPAGKQIISGGCTYPNTRNSFVHNAPKADLTGWNCRGIAYNGDISATSPEYPTRPTAHAVCGIYGSGGSEGGNGYTGELWKCTCGTGINIVTTSNLTAGSVCISGGTATSVQYATWSCARLQNSGTTGTVVPPVTPPVVPAGFTYGCPTGFIEIGYRHQCIEENLSTYAGGGTKTYQEAAVICAQKGGNLCNMYEWREACQNGVLNDVHTNSNAEWIEGDMFQMYRQIVTPNGVSLMGLRSHLSSGVITSGCNGWASLEPSSSLPSFKHPDIKFRCCADKELTEN